MEFLPSNRPQRPGQLATTDPRTLAVRKAYGDLPQLCKTFGVTAQRYCARNVELALRKGVPSFARIIITYGEDGISALIGTHITEAILRMGEDQAVDEYDVDFIARAICESDRFRPLSMASILRFFHLLKCGEFDIYGKVTPRKILEAFRKYAIDQQEREWRILQQIEREQKEKEEEEARKNAIPWEEWAKRLGVDPSIGFDGYLKLRINGQKPKPKKEPIVIAIEAIAELIRILKFVKEYNDEIRRSKK